MSAAHFRSELELLINRNRMESGSNTPDFVLAKYLEACLDAFDYAVHQRETWYGRAFTSPAPAASTGEGGARRPVCWHRNVTTYEEGSTCNDCGGAILDEDEWHRMHGPRAQRYPW